MGQVERFRLQAQACAALGSPLYASLLERAAEDLESGGVTAAVIAGYEDAPLGAAVSLRMLGAVHRLVLTGAAPDLAVRYPSAGGSYAAGDIGTDDQVWSAFEDTLTTRLADVRDALRRPPQTNETGRSLPLLGALQVVSGRSGGRAVRLVEIGASAGLNLRADALRPVHRPADLAALPPGRPYEVVLRLGCDPDPLDPTTEDGRLTLMSYVWPDDLVRFDRLRDALDVAARVPAVVVRAGAAGFLRDLHPEDGAVTVLWHSVMWQYLDADEQRAVLDERDRLAAEATADGPFAHARFEPQPTHDRADFEVRLGWAGGDGRLTDELLGLAPPHGVPVTWSAGVLTLG